MKRSSVIAAVAILAGIAVTGGGLAYYKHRELHPAEGQAGFEPAETVEVVAARELEWRATADLIGTVFSLRSVRVSNELAGTVRSVEFESGTVVEAGQVLLTLDDSTDRADLAAAQASVRVAEANAEVAAARLELARTELRGREEAAGARALAGIELDRARSELAAAIADQERAAAEVDEARARVAQVETRLRKMVITAPFRARAGLRLVHEGQYLMEGTVVVNLEEVSDRIYLDFAVPQEHAARAHPGMAAMASSPVLGPDPTRIEVVAVDSAVDGDTRNVRVRAIVDNPGQRLRPGMFVQVRVPVEEARRYVAVPSTAVRRAPYGDQVFVVEPGEKPETLRAKHRFVKLGPTVGGNVIVLEGIAAGEQLAASGSFKLRDGALVARAAAPAEPRASK